MFRLLWSRDQRIIMHATTVEDMQSLSAGLFVKVEAGDPLVRPEHAALVYMHIDLLEV